MGEEFWCAFRTLNLRDLAPLSITSLSECSGFLVIFPHPVVFFSEDSDGWWLQAEHHSVWSCRWSSSEFLHSACHWTSSVSLLDIKSCLNSVSHPQQHSVKEPFLSDRPGAALAVTLLPPELWETHNWAGKETFSLTVGVGCAASQGGHPWITGALFQQWQSGVVGVSLPEWLLNGHRKVSLTVQGKGAATI